MRPMAYDEQLANRIRELVADQPGLTEPEGVAAKRQLERWVQCGVEYARSLAAKG